MIARGAIVAAAMVAAGGLGYLPQPAITAAAAGFAGNGYVQAPGGAFMADAFGRKLEFHGFNLVAKCPADSRPSSAPGTPCVPRRPGDPLGDTNYYLDPASSDPDRTFTDADAANFAALGFNVARVGIIWRALEPGPANPLGGNRPDNPNYCGAHSGGSFAPLPSALEPFDNSPGGPLQTYLRHIDTEVSLLAAHGIHSMIDMHQDAWNEHFNNPNSATPWEGEGAPLWATCTSPTALFPNPVDTSSHTAGWSASYFDNPAMAVAYDHFWNNDVRADLQGEYLRTWRAVAQHFASNQWVLGYDPFNEPYDGVSTAAFPNFDRKLQCFYGGASNPSCLLALPHPQNVGGMIPVLETADPNHLVFIEASVFTDFGGVETVGARAFGGLPFGKVVLNFHNYGTGSFLGKQNSCSDATCQLDESLTQVQFEVARGQTSTNQPGGPAWFLSEFGAEDDATDIGRVTAIADSSPLTGTPVSWTYWAGLQSHDPTGSPAERLFTRSPNEVVQPKGLVLTRAYPRATAGTPKPGSQKFDPATGAFDFAYTPNHAIAAPTEIVVPAARYGAGYRVTVSGATVTSACGANPVTLAAAPTASTVTVHLEPANGCGSSLVRALAEAAVPAELAGAAIPGGVSGAGVSAGMPNTAAAIVGPHPAVWISGGLALVAVIVTGALRRRRLVRHSGRRNEA